MSSTSTSIADCENPWEALLITGSIDNDNSKTEEFNCLEDEESLYEECVYLEEELKKEEEQRKEENITKFRCLDKIGKKKNDHTICDSCNVSKIREDESLLVCPECGEETRIITSGNKYCLSINNDHNTLSSSYMPVKISGKSKNRYYYNRSLLKTGSNYTKFRKMVSLREFMDYIYNDNRLPKNVIILANNIFDKVKSDRSIFRSSGKRGIHAACLYYACHSQGITKTPQVLASIVGVPDKFISNGFKTLQEKAEAGLIEIPSFINPIRNYVNQYFESLNMSNYLVRKSKSGKVEILDQDVQNRLNTYKEFIVSLINKAEQKNVHVMNDSKMTTKVVGALWMLTRRIKEFREISKDELHKACGTSKSTFTRYYKLLYDNNLKLRKPFKKYRIPMPYKWKNWKQGDKMGRRKKKKTKK